MPWKQMEVREQRVEFVVRALRGTEPLSQLCREFGISRPTGYLWLTRYREGGVAAIEERSRRPDRSPGRPRRSWRRALLPCAKSIRTGARANWLCCWIARISNCHPARSIAWCCASVWCAIRAGTGPPCGVSSANSRTSFGRWTSRGRRTGQVVYGLVGNRRSQPLFDRA